MKDHKRSFFGVNITTLSYVQVEKLTENGFRSYTREFREVAKPDWLRLFTMSMMKWMVLRPLEINWVYRTH